MDRIFAFVAHRHHIHYDILAKSLPLHYFPLSLLLSQTSVYPLYLHTSLCPLRFPTCLRQRARPMQSGTTAGHHRLVAAEPGQLSRCVLDDHKGGLYQEV